MPKPKPKPELKIEARYRVKAKQTVGPRSRALVISATSREHAKSQAIEQIGSDWEIVEVKPA